MIFQRRFLLISAVLVIAVGAACSSTQVARNSVAQAVAILYDVNGSPVGTATRPSSSS